MERLYEMKQNKIKMTHTIKFKLLKIIGLLLFLTPILHAKTTIEIKHQAGDMTSNIRAALEEIEDKEIVLVFEEAVYEFLPDYAVGKYCFITNHDNGYKKIIFPLEGFDSVEIEGNGAELIFHGQTFPFQFHNCQSIQIKDLTIDWDTPFTFQGEVMGFSEEENWIDFKPSKEDFSWNFRKGRFTFPNIDGYAFSSLGSSLYFDAEHKRVAHGAYDFTSNPKSVEKLKGGVFRIHESKKRKHYPPLGSILNFQGTKGANSDAPAFQVTNSKDIHFDKVIIHHALGMGFLFERSENITLSNCGVHLRDDTPRVISATADATHFCNCKGDILVENCRFENMLDDGTNVHGTYVEVDEVLDEYTARVALKHFQQSGFEFAGAGDEIWFIHQPDPQRKTTNTVKEVKTLNDTYSIIHFADKLPEGTRKGDLLENKTWNPTFTMRGCTIRDHRARNIVIKTPKKIVIENNKLSSMMSSILFRGESFYWFESGSVEDVLIQNNHFNYCAYSGSEHAVMYVTPRLGKAYDSSISFDRNIRFINNTIETFDQRIVIADRVDGLTITNNTITHTPTEKPLYPDTPTFDLTNCTNVKISGNTYKGGYKKSE